MLDVTLDGREGLFLATSEYYDVIVLDRMMPIMDDLPVLKALGGGGKTPIIILSAMDQGNEKVEGSRSGADDYLATPFSFVKLLARVEKLSPLKASVKSWGNMNVRT
ncbi:response regulator [Puniceicoccaceae bacterium K14]|nr:response regulator [Puniceicoccaceae bacterium K14]